MVRKGLTLFTFIVLFAACDRAKKDSSAVLIQLPQTQNFSKVSAYSISALDFIYPEFDKYVYDTGWAQTPPSGLSGDQPINCFAVMVSGPEANMSSTLCGREDYHHDHTIIYDASKPHNFYMGQFAGAAPAGGLLQIDVPSGPDRVFRLLGFHTANETDCQDLHYDNNRAKLSRPYIISTSAKTPLAAGSEIVLPMEMNFDKNIWFDSCEGPAVDGVGDVRESASHLTIYKAQYPHEKMTVNTCQPIDIRLVDDSFRPEELPDELAAIQVRLAVRQTLGAPSADIVTYDSLSDCSGVSNSHGAFNMYGNNSAPVRRWLQTPPSGSDFYVQALTVSATTHFGTGSSFGHSDEKHFGLEADGAGHFKVVGPRSGLPGEKYIYRVYPRTNSFSIVSTTSATFDISVSVPSGGTPVSILDPGTCISPLGTTVTIPDGNNQYGEFCVQFNGAPGDKQILSISNPGGTYSTTPAAMSIDISTSGGSNQPHHLLFTGPQQLVGTGCFGPFTIHLKNEHGVNVINNSGSPLGMGLSFSDQNNLVMKTDGTCSANATSPAIAIGESYYVFYLQVTAAPTLGQRSINARHTSTYYLFDGRVYFNID